MKEKKSGFTLIEMLIVVTIIAILAVIIIPRFNATTEQARYAQFVAEKAHHNGTVERFFFINGFWPVTDNILDWYSVPMYEEYYPEGVPSTDIYGTPWIFNPMTKRIMNEPGGFI